MNKCSEVTAHTGADSLEIPIASMLPVLAGFEADPDILWMLQSSPFCLCVCVQEHVHVREGIAMFTWFSPTLQSYVRPRASREI